MMEAFEKLGVFYLGREYDIDTGTRRPSLLLYDSKDLVTHGVCVGMTGSGKTGLCLSLLEEAALDGIPVIAIDPKGDLGNLLLTFPALAAEDFRPWINEDDARRRDQTPDAYAAGQAARWRTGLAEWGQDGDRIARLRVAADFAIYTPGSTAGLPLSILRSLDAPPPAIVQDQELLAERVSSTATSLLTLAGVDAEVNRSREHVLVAAILHHAWSEGQRLDLAAFVQQIQQPPMTRLGVLEVESFFPAGDRFQLATRFNTLLAAPGFASWMDGDPLSADALLFTPDGRPRVSIVSIAHLGDRERMFVVSLLLNELLGWMRSQTGTTSLRALVYMDEVFGYFPPVANPPSKAPLLTLLKQGRAFGLGVLLATQNPVDLDYKGLSNAGTWFLGRLQTERDKARVLDGLEGVSASARGGFDRARVDRTLSSLGSRVFLLHNVHQDEPVVFETRWAMSYLRGPLTRDQIRQVMEPRRRDVAGDGAAAPIVASPVSAAGATPTSSEPPLLPPGIPQFFVPCDQPPLPDAALVYEPRIVASASVVFADARIGVNHTRTVTKLAGVDPRLGTPDWDAADDLETFVADLPAQPRAGAAFDALPPAAAKPQSYGAWEKDFKPWLSSTARLDLLQSPAAGIVSEPEESEREFRIRLSTAIREQRDVALAKLRQKYASKLAAMDEKVRRAQQAVDRETQQATQQKLQTGLSIGATVLGALLGRKAVSTSTLGRATTAARGMGRSMKEQQDIARAKDTLEALLAQKADLEARIEAEIDAAGGAFDAQGGALAPLAVRPKRGAVSVLSVGLAWVPFVVGADGARRRA